MTEASNLKSADKQAACTQQRPDTDQPYLPQTLSFSYGHRDSLRRTCSPRWTELSVGVSYLAASSLTQRILSCIMIQIIWRAPLIRRSSNVDDISTILDLTADSTSNPIRMKLLIPPVLYPSSESPFNCPSVTTLYSDISSTHALTSGQDSPLTKKVP
jgi:hypothetical protein